MRWKIGTCLVVLALALIGWQLWRDERRLPAPARVNSDSHSTGRLPAPARVNSDSHSTGRLPAPARVTPPRESAARRVGHPPTPPIEYQFERPCEGHIGRFHRERAQTLIAKALEVLNPTQRIQYLAAVHGMQELMFERFMGTRERYQQPPAIYEERLKALLGADTIKRMEEHAGRSIGLIQMEAYEGRAVRNGQEPISDAMYFASLGSLMSCVNPKQSRHIIAVAEEKLKPAIRTSQRRCDELAHASQPRTFDVQVRASLSVESEVARFRNVQINCNNWPADLKNPTELEDCYLDIWESAETPVKGGDTATHLSVSWEVDAKGA
jgi:hypothetical protein